MAIDGSASRCAAAEAEASTQNDACTEEAECTGVVEEQRTVLDDSHRDLRDDEFWRHIPAYAGLTADEFHDHRFQSRNCITSAGKLRDVLQGRVSDSFYADVEAGVRGSTMSLRLSPYLLALVDWDAPETDPIRTQFLPLASRFRPDHPELHFDSLNEQADSPAPGLTHRYYDRALLLALDTCPVYCRYCTRSYSVGLHTEEVEKVHFGATLGRWEQAFDYIRRHLEIEDVVVSGGDMYNLKAEQVALLGRTLLDIDHVRRFRYATKGPAVMPQKLITDDEWVEAVAGVAEEGRRRHKQVSLHTHFNHPAEITAITRQGLDRLQDRGVIVRNQAVLQRGVNDDAQTMVGLIRRLSYLNVQPYYVFVHDMVPGVEELRTTLQSAIDLEKQVRGVTAGFNIPAFVLDTMGGGGKRHVHSHEHYDREAGIAVFISPVVRPGRQFFYFDPIHELGVETQGRWADAEERAAIIQAARQAAGS
ncbi:MAG: KamA family radical SAM protein [Candidatus Latescibacterota bacterium]